jgi:hypothetical protein
MVSQTRLLSALENVALTANQKLYFLNRYLDLVCRYRVKYHRINRLYNTLRIIVMVGSIFIPALLTLQKDPVTLISETTYWVVFALSLCVTLSNSLLELFNVAALNTKYWLHVHRLETEGWQFLNLSEGYAKFDNIQDAFVKFASKIEKLHLGLVFDLLRLESKNKASSSGSEVKGDTVSTTNGGGSLSHKNLYAMQRPLELGLDNESVTDMDHIKLEHGKVDGSKPTPSMLVSLQEFQTRLDESKTE